MPKVLTISGMVVAFLTLLLFGLDLGVGFPFSKASQMMDISFVICALVLAYLSWSAWKDLT
jgi:threonine/homoserine/homoserine lactone efflux protein